jgi:hypothetical protein
MFGDVHRRKNTEIRIQNPECRMKKARAIPGLSRRDPRGILKKPGRKESRNGDLEFGCG